MSALRMQGIVFCILAIVCAGASGIFPPLSESVGVLILGAIILLFGVPHGALDTVFADRLYRVHSLANWIVFCSVYLALGMVTLLIWQLVPLAFLIGFLVTSAFHFSGDPAKGTPWFARLLQGGAVIVLPALLHAREESRLLAFISGDTASRVVMNGLALVSVSWLIALVAVALIGIRRDWLTSLEMISTAALALFAPPLVAFTLFFCCMHSARHILRTVEYSGQPKPGQTILVSAARAAAFPMLGSMVLFGAGLLWLNDLRLEPRVIQVVFVGLAALTVPHILLVERARMNGWSPIRA